MKKGYKYLVLQYQSFESPSIYDFETLSDVKEFVRKRQADVLDVYEIAKEFSPEKIKKWK